MAYCNEGGFMLSRHTRHRLFRPVSRRALLAGIAASAAGVAATNVFAPDIAAQEVTMSASKPQLLLSNRVLVESPRWHEDRLWFSDWGTQEIVAVDLAGKSEVIRSIPSMPFSFDWQPDGRMVIVSGGDGLLLRQTADGAFETFADLSSLSAFPWNEIVVDGRGNTYLNNIGFNFPEEEFAPGILALVAPDGEVRQVADGVAFPNGMVITPDNATLILAESYGNTLTAFDIAADGSLENRRVWANLEGDYPDGITLDAEGAVWYGDVPNQHCVRVREGGEVLQTIELDRGCFACMLGGEHGNTLFMLAATWGDAESSPEAAAPGQILMVEAPAAGAGWP